MQAMQVQFTTSQPAITVTANRKLDAMIEIVAYENDKPIHTQFLGVDDFRGLFSAAKKVFEACGYENPSTQQIRLFCQAIHPMMSQSEVLRSMAGV